MSSPDCLKCDGWGCTWCRPQVSRGEQALPIEDLREGALKDRVRDLEAGLREAIAALEYEDADLEASRARKVLRGEA